MKILYLHAKDFITEINLNARCQRRIRKKMKNILPEITQTDRITKSENSLLALICVEKGDRELDLRLISADILKARALIGVQEIIISSFGHLSNNLAEAATAKQIIDQITALVSEEFIATKLVPFGWHKSLGFYVPMHAYNCAFRSF